MALTLGLCEARLKTGFFVAVQVMIMPDTKTGKIVRSQPKVCKKTRDANIERRIRSAKAAGLQFQRFLGRHHEPLSVYSELPFPLSFREEGDEISFPSWERITDKLRLKIAVLLLQEWNILSFDLKIHPSLEEAWVKAGKRVAEQCRDRIRKELAAYGLPGREFLFVIEGRGREGRTRLHIHGGVLFHDDSELQAIQKALDRAVTGKGIRGKRSTARDRHFQKFYGSPDGRWENYIMKTMGMPDKRISGRRIVMSQTTTQAARDFYDWITGRG